MSLFTSLLQPPANDRSRNQIILWWEKRRIVYNAVMLVAGSLSLLIGFLIGQLTFDPPGNFLLPIFMIALAANLFYTLGWLVEIISGNLIKGTELIQKVGPLLFIGGTCFSLFVTFLIDIVLIVARFFGS